MVALAAPCAFATVDPNVGVATVPDRRVERLGEMSGSKSLIHATVQFVDIAGLVKGASRGEGLGNRFLSHIREVDAIVFVLRAFHDDDVPGTDDPVDQLETLELELTLADIETLERQLDKRRKAARSDPSVAAEVAATDVALASLHAGTPLFRAGIDADTRALLRPLFLLTNKPAMAVVNIGESQLDEADAIAASVSSALGEQGAAIAVCVQVEAEAVMLDPQDRAEMLDAYGLGEGALATFLHGAYRMLGLRTYLTTGEKETRAWTFRAGARAPQAAGVIHTDFERGFIRAECIQAEELIECGSWAKAREAGTVRVEGKDYVVCDGDVMDFRFNV
ncbi:MAG: redox-regulated ATPase YchF [Microthrixaceae bacterium]